jgi:GNAT superfamily N-acetyltransferase
MRAQRPGPGTEAVLTDGTRLRLRPIGPDDKAGLTAGMARLSPESKRRRFFSAKDRLSESALAYLTEVDYADHFAWVALALDEPGQPIVGVARYIRVAGQPDGAEFALAVIDEYQGRGLGSLLFEALEAVARANGIQRFVAHVLNDNLPMRGIVEDAGGRLEADEPGVLRSEIDISAPAGDFTDEVRYRAAAGIATPWLPRPHLIRPHLTRPHLTRPRLRRPGRGGNRNPSRGARRARERASGVWPGGA